VKSYSKLEGLSARDGDLIGKFEEKPFPKLREIIVDTVEQGLKRHHMKGLIELDVTEGREYIRKHKEKTGEELSLTGWIIKCIGQAVNENNYCSINYLNAQYY